MTRSLESKKLQKSDGELQETCETKLPQNTQKYINKKVSRKPPQNDVFFRPQNCETSVPEQVLCLTTKFIPLHDD